MRPLIVDIGSYALKIGFGGEYAPRFDLPLVMGQIKENIDFLKKKRIFQELNIKNLKQEYFLGQEALYLRNYLDLKWLYNGRSILDEFFFEKVFELASDLLKANQTILISQPFYSNVVNQFGEKLFSAYNAYEVVPAVQPLLNFIASGTDTGLMVDIGHFLTQITPVINGVILGDGARVVDIGGKDITDLLEQLLIERNTFAGIKESSMLSPESLSETIKELYCYVSRDPAEELDNPRRRGSDIKFPLLYDETIQIQEERFLAPEVLFTPHTKNVDPLDKLIADIVVNYDAGIQQALLGNIIITGGTSLLPGLAERIYEELVRKFIDFDYKINVVPFAQFGSPRYSTFFGAAKLTATDVYNSFKISRVDYEMSGAINLPVTFLEEFFTIFQKTTGAELKPIVISVKNFFNSYLFQQLYNVVNSQRETSIKDLGTQLKRSPLELYQMVETLISYNIVQGEIQGFDFINTQFQEEVEEHPVQVEAVKPEPEVQRVVSEEQPYVPSFQRLDAQMTPQRPLEPSETPEEVVDTAHYQYTFQKIDAQMQDKWAQDPTILSGKGKGGPKTEIVEDAGYTFERIDKQKAAEFASDPTIITEARSSTPRKKTPEAAGFTFEKVDNEKAAEWAEEGLISTPKKPAPKGFFDDVALPVAGGEEVGTKPTFEEVDREKLAEWEQEGLVSTRQKPTPKGFFEEGGRPVSSGPEAETGFTFEKIDKEKAEEWAKDETIITEEKKAARSKLMQLIDEGPSYMKADKAKEQEWQDTGLISIPKISTPKGFFVQPSTLDQVDEDTPTFLRIKDQEVPQPRKVLIADLLKPKTDTKTALPKKSKLPTFLEGKDLSEDQQRQLRAFEEEERRKKEKEEKLL